MNLTVGIDNSDFNWLILNSKCAHLNVLITLPLLEGLISPKLCPPFGYLSYSKCDLEFFVVLILFLTNIHVLTYNID